MATSSSDKDIIAAGVDTLYMLWGASMVFFMQAGFTALEVGHVSVKNTKSVLTKNVGDAMIGSLMWWLLGYGFAFGNDSGGFIGKTLFAFSGSDFPDGYSFSVWLFEWAFAATAATIVSGAVAERVNFTGWLWLDCGAPSLLAFLFLPAKRVAASFRKGLHQLAMRA